MNKVVTINLHGTAYQLEDAGYEALKAYLSGAADKLAANPDKDEIIADIEQAIGDKCRATLTAFKTVVLAKEINQIISEMGSVDDGSTEAAEKPAAGTTSSPTPEPMVSRRPKRLYRFREGAMIGGVCAGLAAYFEIDPTIVRLIFALVSILTYGTGILVYFVMMIVIPYADSVDDKAAAYGEPMTAKEFIRRAKAGYYEGVKSFGDRTTRREWQGRFKRDVRDWSRSMRSEVRGVRGHWFQDWHHGWQGPRPSLAGAILFPIIALFSGLLSIAMVLVVLSLITTGAIFETALPVGMPVWVAILLIVVGYNIALLPLRIAKGVFMYGSWGRRSYHSLAYGPLHSIVWICLIVFGVSYASHHVPEFHRFMDQVNPAIHNGIHSFKEWWARQ